MFDFDTDIVNINLIIYCLSICYRLGMIVYYG